MILRFNLIAPGEDSPEILKMCHAIRDKVFIEEQEVPREVERDDNDSTRGHLLLSRGSEGVGTLRIRLTEQGIKLERIAVMARERGKKFGQLLIKEGIKRSRELYPTEPIYILSQVQAAPFYASLGFVESGDEYIEEGNRLHVTMTLSPEAEAKIFTLK